MSVSRVAAPGSTRPQRQPLLEAVIEAFKVPDLRTRILFTFVMLLIFRFIAHIPLPGVDKGALDDLFGSAPLLGALDLFSGGALRNLSIAAMGVYPYITASIVMQLLVPVIPSLKALSKEGDYGRQKINQIVHWATVPICILQGYGQLLLLQRSGVIANVGFTGDSFIPTLAMVLSLTAGTMFLVWLGELITERGIGNGVSLIIFAGIVASFPSLVGQGFLERSNSGGLLLLVLLGAAIVWLIVVFTEAQRRIPVQYGRTLFRGGTVQRAGGTSFIPLKVNSAGMIPLIFAFSILILPATMASYFADPLKNDFVSNAAETIVRIFDIGHLIYWIFLFVLVVVFTFFYTLVTFAQMNLAENLQKNGGFIPGIRPGKPTQEYLLRVLTRITWAGAIFLGFVAIVPYLAGIVTNIKALTLSSTALLIMVGVALDTMRQLEAQLLMRKYEGFIK